MNPRLTDLFIIGGGINGCGIAYDAAGRGLSVRLCEMSDLAAETSSYSSKLIHGGLRYLESYEFRLVHEALKEREVLLKIAPHLVHPLHILMPHDKHHRPQWMIKLGLFLYDHLNLSQSLSKSRSLKIKPEFPEEPLNYKIHTAFEYSDCTVDDSRLVLHLALGAKKHNAEILTHHRVEKITRELELELNHFKIQVVNLKTNKPEIFYAKSIINAAGPWVEEVLKKKSDINIHASHSIKLIKGSHLIIKKFYLGDQAYLLQNNDNRVIFIIPYRDDFTLIGTTDLIYEGDPHEVKISQEEITYLLESCNQYFKNQITQDQIVLTYSGVRPLKNDEHENPSKITRDYSFEIDTTASNQLPFLSIFGGKITTYRKLSEHALEKLKPYFPHMGPAWTAQEALPGGDFASFKALELELSDRYSFLNKKQVHRIAYAYGTRAFEWLREAKTLEDCGEYFGQGLTEREVDFMIRTEWARSTEDILWRRSKLKLYFTKEETQKLQSYLDGRDDWI